MVGLAGEGQNFDGNGHVRALPAGRRRPDGLAPATAGHDTRRPLYGQRDAEPLGHAARVPGQAPAVQARRPCYTHQIPNLNGPTGPPTAADGRRPTRARRARRPGQVRQMRPRSASTRGTSSRSSALFVVALWSSAATSCPTSASTCRTGCRSSARTSSTTRPSSRPRSRSRPGQGQTVHIAGVTVGEIGERRAQGRPRGRDDEDPAKYTPIYKDATALLRPEDRPERHDRRADAGLEAARARRPSGCTIPVSQTLPERQRSTRSSPRSTATRATTCSCWSAARGQGLDGQRHDAVGDVPALRADRPRPRQDQRRAGRAPRRTSAARSTTSALLDRGARRQGRRSSPQLVDSSNARLPVASPSRTRSLREALQLLPATLRRDEHGAGQGRPAGATCSARRSATLRPGRPRARARAAPDAAVPRRHDAGHPEPAAPVRARRAADGARPAPGGARPRGR